MNSLAPLSVSGIASLTSAGARNYTESTGPIAQLKDCHIDQTRVIGSAGIYPARPGFPSAADRVKDPVDRRAQKATGDRHRYVS
jgi:hypothetical protein